jgi:hypothetical protein
MQLPVYRESLENKVDKLIQAQTAMMEAITQLAKSQTSNFNNGSNGSHVNFMVVKGLCIALIIR